MGVGMILSAGEHSSDNECRCPPVYGEAGVYNGVYGVVRLSNDGRE